MATEGFVAPPFAFLGVIVLAVGCLFRLEWSTNGLLIVFVVLGLKDCLSLVTIGGYPVRYRGLNQHQFQFKIFLENDQNIVLKAVKDFMRVDVENPTQEYFGDSVGLMGSFDGDRMLARDGSDMTDVDAFGQEWQVRVTEPMLFHDIQGVQHPEMCAMPAIERESRRLEGSISREQAEVACAHVAKDSMEDCVADAMATNDVEMAGAF